ncbi:hypothetical protein ACFC0S_00370 [Streptomyces sp. NPDC056084]|uniref:hypothetical protein n=1 Tax=unclassified Streptomyces TaxID=2593676 RepID=UPI0035DE479F
MNDDVPLTEVLREARFHTVDMLGIPAEYSAVVEASAAWQIVQEADHTIDSPFGRKIAQGLARIEQSPVEEQQRLVRAAAPPLRNHRTATPSITTPKPSPRPFPLNRPIPHHRALRPANQPGESPLAHPLPAPRRCHRSRHHDDQHLDLRPERFRPCS